MIYILSDLYPKYIYIYIYIYMLGQTWCMRAHFLAISYCQYINISFFLQIFNRIIVISKTIFFSLIFVIISFLIMSNIYCIRIER